MKRTTSLALQLLALCLIAAGCGDEPDRANEQHALAIEALRAGKITSARQRVRDALQSDPYHAGANLLMAHILEEYGRETSRPIEYYNRYLTLATPDSATRSNVQMHIDLLAKIDDGTLEDPKLAARDILLAATDQSPSGILQRLHPEFLASLLKSSIPPDTQADDWINRILAHDNLRVIRRTFRLQNGHIEAITQVGHDDEPPYPYTWVFQQDPEQPAIWLLTDWSVTGTPKGSE